MCLINKLMDTYDHIIGNYQAGFWKGKCVNEHITIKQYYRRVMRITWLHMYACEYLRMHTCEKTCECSRN